MKPGQIRVFDGLRLTTEHVDHLQASWRSSVEDLREALGLGLVYRGCEVTVESNAVTVQPGLAFDFQKSRLVLDEPKTVTLDLASGEDTRFVCLKYDRVETEKVENQYTLIFDSCSVVLAPALPAPKDNLVPIARLTRGSDGIVAIVPLSRAADLLAIAAASLLDASTPPASGVTTNGTTPANVAAGPTEAGTGAASPPVPPPSNPAMLASDSPPPPAATPTPAPSEPAVVSGVGTGASPPANDASTVSGSAPAPVEAPPSSGGAVPSAPPTPVVSAPIGPPTTAPGAPAPTTEGVAPSATATPTPSPARWLVRQGIERLDPGTGADQDLAALLVGPLRNRLAAQSAKSALPLPPAPELSFSLLEREVPIEYSIVGVSSQVVLSASIKTTGSAPPAAPVPSAAPVPPIGRISPLAITRPSPLATPVIAPTPPPGLPPTLATTSRAYRAAGQGEATFGSDGLVQFGMSTTWSDSASATAPAWPTDLTELGIGILNLGARPSDGPQPRTIEEVLGKVQLLLRVDKGATSGFKLVASLVWIGGVDEGEITMLQAEKPMLSWSGVLGWKAQGGIA